MHHPKGTSHLSLIPVKSSCLLTTSLVTFILSEYLAHDPLTPVVASLTGRYGEGCLYSVHWRDEPTVASNKVCFGSFGAGSL